MVFAFDIYLIGILDSVRGALAVLLIILGVAGALCVAFGFDSDSDSDSDSNKKRFFFSWAKRLFITAVIPLVLHTFIPSTKTAAAMYVLPAIINSEAVQELPSELTTLAREWVQELRPKKNLKEF